MFHRWIGVFLLLMVAESICYLLSACINKTHSWMLYKRITQGLFRMPQLAWLIYGCVILHEDKIIGQCRVNQKFDNTVILMLICLVLGSMIMLISFVQCIILVMLACFNLNPAMKLTLAKISGCSNIFEEKMYESQCKMCAKNYCADSEVIQLSCSEKHFLHAYCMAKHLQAGKEFCPFCREQVTTCK